ncbi:MAG TPA: hypothetical protein VIN08_25510 [Ohtaekwangia sp.]
MQRSTYSQRIPIPCICDGRIETIAEKPYTARIHTICEADYSWLYRKMM